MGTSGAECDNIALEQRQCAAQALNDAGLNGVPWAIQTVLSVYIRAKLKGLRSLRGVEK
jgi:hypothetical protein